MKSNEVEMLSLSFNEYLSVRRLFTLYFYVTLICLLEVISLWRIFDKDVNMRKTETWLTTLHKGSRRK